MDATRQTAYIDYYHNYCLVLLSPKTPLVGERWDYPGVVEVNKVVGLKECVDATVGLELFIGINGYYHIM